MAQKKKNKSNSKKIKLHGIFDKSVGNHENDPYVVKKYNEAKAFLKMSGLPKNLAKSK